MRYFCILAFTTVYQLAHAQLDSIYDQGSYRTFIIHLPSGYNENTDYPLVLNLHGLGSSAFEQQLYSQFDAIADAEQFIVVYANAIDNNWDLFGATDINFISHLVDTLRQRYSTNNCLFSTGMSQGGFLSYKLACELPQSITAIAVVTGNMLIAWQNSCDIEGTMPVMHFHGTADQVVNYNGSFGVSPVEGTALWWAEENNCNDPPFITELPDIDTNDNSTVEKHIYWGCDAGGDVLLYKIINGGHTWPGTFPVQSLGNTNQDINASELIGDFFSEHCTISTSFNSIIDQNDILVYPNPAIKSFTLSWPDQIFDIIIYDLEGRKVFVQKENSGNIEINTEKLQAGVYIIQLKMKNDIVLYKKITVQR